MRSKLSFFYVGLLLVLWMPIEVIKADFVFPDFNQTTGIAFVGDTGTSSCAEVDKLKYGQVQGDADLFTESFRPERSEGPDLYIERTVETNVQETSTSITNETAGFRHKTEFKNAPSDRCATRIRLTPSGPDKKGGIWFRKRMFVNRGFETMFTFQITDMSRECTLHRDVGFSLKHHQTCSVRGGDGFAFVIHHDPRKLETVGDVASSIGYGGIKNSIAVEFDTWYNPETGVDLIASDHITIQSRGAEENSPDMSAQLSRPRIHPLSDGKVHLAKVAYFPEVNFDYLANFTATENLLPYIVDNTEGRRLGTMVVWMDEGIEKDVPIVAIPINLSKLLSLPQETAFIGFTSSTGRAWEKHDILSWYWCDEEPCRSFERSQFDYHQTSKFNVKSSYRKSTPGKGYGSGSKKEVPTKHESPNTEPLDAPIAHRSSQGRNQGLYENAASQVPPDTMF